MTLTNPVAASPQYGVDGQTDVFAIHNGQLTVTWAEASGWWQGPAGLGPAGLAPPGAAVAASPQYGVDGQTDVFVIGGNGQLQVFWVEGGGHWQGPAGLGPAQAFPAGAGVAASQRYGQDGVTDVFAQGGDGLAYVFWVPGAGQWQGPSAATDVIRAVGDQIDFDFPSITFGNGVPVGGHAHLTMFKSGDCRFTGSFHDSGATEYNMASLVTVKDLNNVLFTASVQGHVSGTFQSGSRDFDWDQSIHDNRVSDRWTEIANGCTAKVHSDANGDLVNLTNSAIGAAGLVLAVIALFA